VCNAYRQVRGEARGGGDSKTGGPDDDEESVAQRGGRGPSRFGIPDEPGLPRRNSRAGETLKIHGQEIQIQISEHTQGKACSIMLVPYFFPAPIYVLLRLILVSIFDLCATWT
jgi:hypothetical protein